MVNYFGYCPSLRKKVDFEVSEVVDIPTKRGMKYQIKGTYEGRLCNTFCSAETAQELRSQIGSPQVFTIMEAEESQENLGQATQEESVPAIIGPSEEAYGQQGESAQELPLAETVPTPIIDADGIGIEPIDDLSLPDATLADMQETLDEPPVMDANFEIAEMQPEGDGSSIGNIAPMNPDAPLHAEDFESEEGMANLGQATQEESVPAIIGPSEEAYGQQGESAQELPLAETVPTPIIDADGIGIEPIDNLSSFNGGDILSQMESDLGERPDILADFAIRPIEPFGDGRSIGNITPTNPDVPFASEDDDDDENMNKIANMRKYFMDKLGYDDVEQLEEYFEKMDDEADDDDDFDAETFDPLTVEEIEVMAQVPPPVCFEEKIPPSVWENTSIQAQEEYAETGNESVLLCPQCGISKADLRKQGGYCGTTDPESEEYISTRSCPYEKYFSPQHWIDEPQVISHITPEKIVLEDTLTTEIDMPPIDPLPAGIETRFIPNKMFYQINQFLPKGVVSKQSLDGQSYELTYYSYDTDAVEKVIDTQAEQEGDMMFGAESKPSKTAEKAILTGASTGATMEIADALLAAEGGITLASDEYRLCEICESTHHENSFSNSDDEEQTLTPKGKVCDGCFGDILFDDFQNADDRDWAKQYLESKGFQPHTIEGSFEDGFGAETFEADGEEFMYHVYISDYSNSVGFIDESNRDFENQSDAKKAAEKVAKNEGKGKWVLVIAEIAEDEYQEIIYEITPDGDVYDAEEFNVEFDDWADQEMLTHGENVSFKEWAKEEGKKHGDMDLTDWAEEEEESHDERYGAEDDTWFYYNLDRGVYRLPISDGKIIGLMKDREYEMRTGFPNAHELLSNAKEASSKSAKLNASYGAETFESQSAQTKVKPPVKSIGILLGLGAMAAVFAPESLRKLFNK